MLENKLSLSTEREPKRNLLSAGNLQPACKIRCSFTEQFKTSFLRRAPNSAAHTVNWKTTTPTVNVETNHFQ